MKKATPYLRSPLFLAILIAGGSAFDVRAQDDDADYADNLVLEEIVVTARKRQETLQESPVAISALSAESLKEQGIQSTRDLQQTVPGLTFSEQGSKNPSIFIRGVGQRENNAALDPGVGVYINGIYIPRTDSQLLDTVDTQSVQVLRGPQGTLFGKNNTGGAILVTTLQPHNEGIEGYASTKLGNWGRRDAKVGANVPLNEDTAAMRFSIASVKRDGYIQNITDGRDYGDEDRIAATARIYWQATDIFSVDTFLYWAKQNENGAAFTCRFQNDSALYSQVSFPSTSSSNNNYQQACLASERQAEGHNITSAGPSKFQMTSNIAALTLAWELDDIEIKSVTAWSKQADIVVEDDQDGTDLDALSNGTLGLIGALQRSAANGYFGGVGSTPDSTIGGPQPRTPWTMPDDEERQQISQEFQIIGSALDESLSYTVGLFAAWESLDNNVFSQLIGENGYSLTQSAGLNVALPKLLGTQSDFNNDTYAVFAQATYDLNDWLQLTIGGRYTVERREREATIYEADCEYAASLIGAIADPGVPLNSLISCEESLTALFADPALVPGYLSNPPSWMPIRLAEAGYVPDPNSTGYIRVALPQGKIKDDKEFSKFTPTVTLAANIPEDRLGDFINSTLLYFTYSKGFKGGGFEMRGLEFKQFQPETVDNFELGIKMDAWDQRVRFNTALYYMQYDDIQLRIAERGYTLADIYLFISNAGEATIKGLESELTVLPMAGLTLQASLNWTKAEYQEFDATQVVPDSFGIPQQVPVDRSDEDFGSLPELTYSLAAMYDWHTDIGLFIPRLSMYFRDDMYTGIDATAWQPEYRERATIEDVTLWNFRFAYIPNEAFNITLFVDNLTNEDYYQGGFTVAESIGATTITLGPRRTYGLEATYSF